MGSAYERSVRRGVIGFNLVCTVVYTGLYIGLISSQDFRRLMYEKCPFVLTRYYKIFHYLGKKKYQEQDERDWGVKF